MESKIVSLCVMNTDGDVAMGLEPVRVPYKTGWKLRLGDLVSVGFGEAHELTNEQQQEAQGAVVKLAVAQLGQLPSPASQPARSTIPPVRAEVPPFQPATDHEIGIAYFKGLTYQYAYPNGAQPADACRWSHIDETEVREELWDIKPGDVVYDIGSAFGSYALYALAAGAAHVVCFNPNPQEQDLLLASARLNGWGDKITRHNVGLWSESGYLNDEEQTFTKSSGDFKVTKTADGRHTQLFAVQTLDSMMLPDLEGRVVVKMDVEQAEHEVLKGGKRFFGRMAPALILIEQHRFKRATIAEEVTAELDTMGYRLVVDRPYHSVSHSQYVPKAKGWDD